MARELSITVTVLFVLLSLAYARFQSDLPDGVTLTDMPEITKSIVLPDEKPDSETPTVVELQPESESGNVVKLSANIVLEEREESSGATEEKKKTEDAEKTVSEPLTVISFRPINRHFPRHPLLPLRHGHKCRYMFRRGGDMRKPWGPRFNGRGLSYGNDMILSGGRHDHDFDLLSRGVGGVRQIPNKWAKDRYQGPRFSIMRDDMKRREDDDVRKPHRHDHHHRHVVGDEREREHEYEHRQRQRNGHGLGYGFMKRIRKFLNHPF